MIHCLFFDTLSKWEVFKKGLKRGYGTYWFQTTDQKRALTYLQEENPAIVVMGGEIDGGRSTVLLAQMMDKKLVSPKTFYLITTWDADEARALTHLLPNASYHPFSSICSNIAYKHICKLKKHHNI